jgi:hypothetical protein
VPLQHITGEGIAQRSTFRDGLLRHG